MFDHVRLFIDQKSQSSGVAIPSDQLAPKITGMVMSLPLAQLVVSVSQYQNLF